MRLNGDLHPVASGRIRSIDQVVVKDGLHNPLAMRAFEAQDLQIPATKSTFRCRSRLRPAT